MSRTSLTIKHVEKGPKNTGNVPAQLEKSEFFAGLEKIFSKGRVIAKSRLTSSETCYLYGRLTSHLRYVQACLNQCHFETWQVSLFGSILHIGKSLRLGKNSITINPVSPIYSLRELFFIIIIIIFSLFRGNTCCFISRVGFKTFFEPNGFCVNLLTRPFPRELQISYKCSSCYWCWHISDKFR